MHTGSSFVTSQTQWEKLKDVNKSPHTGVRGGKKKVIQINKYLSTTSYGGAGKGGIISESFSISPKNFEHYPAKENRLRIVI